MELHKKGIWNPDEWASPLRYDVHAYFYDVYLRSHDGVVTELHVYTTRPLLQTGLGDLHWHFLVLDGLPQQLNVPLHVEDLLQSLKASDIGREY